MENDVNCAGLAESVSGAGVGSSVTLCLTIGTGIGGCILIDGHVFHGYSNSACEAGYMHMFDSDFQTLGATSILTKKVAARKEEREEKWDGYHIFEAAKAGDEVCIRAIDEMAEVLGRGIANICYVINPEVVVLGGGVMAQEEYLKPRIEKSLKGIWFRVLPIRQNWHLQSIRMMPVCWEHIIIIRTDSVDKNEKRKGIEVKSASLSFLL